MSKEQWNEYAKPIAVLAVICLVTSLLLAVTNSFTAPVIEENERRVAQAAYHELLPTAETFDTVEGWTTPNVLEIVTDPASGSYVIKAQGQGFGGMRAGDRGLWLRRQHHRREIFGKQRDQGLRQPAVRAARMGQPVYRYARGKLRHL